MIDIGANLANESFRTDLEQVLQRARQAGVERIIVTGSDRDSAVAASQLADRHPAYLYATAGLHPHHASDFSEELLLTFAELLRCDNVVAIGETGLDYFRNFSPREAQLAAFNAHLALASELDKPLFLHERDAFEDFAAQMRNYPDLCERAIVHCFTGSREALETYLDMGMYIGITGWICDAQRGKTLREIIRYAPLEKLMIESDAPYLTPHKDTLRNQLVHKHRNEPWTLHYTATALAEALGVDAGQLREVTTQTARDFFRLG